MASRNGVLHPCPGRQPGGGYHLNYPPALHPGCPMPRERKTLVHEHLLEMGRVHRQTDGQVVVYPFGRILLSHKKDGRTNICKSMNLPQHCSLECKEPDQKLVHILFV